MSSGTILQGCHILRRASYSCLTQGLGLSTDKTGRIYPGLQYTGDQTSQFCPLKAANPVNTYFLHRVFIKEFKQADPEQYSHCIDTGTVSQAG